MKLINPPQPPLAHSSPDEQPTQLHQRRHFWEGIGERSRRRDGEMFSLMLMLINNVMVSNSPQQWGYLVVLASLPPCLNSFSIGLSGDARSSGRLPSEFLREGTAPWWRRTDASSGLDRRAAMCRGDSPRTLEFTQAPGEVRRPVRYDHILFHCIYHVHYSFTLWYMLTWLYL